ncbi:MAG: diguanylate cyclase [Pseudomonadota bacterium]
MKIFSFSLGPVSRISIGLVSLTLALVLVFDSIVDILPNQQKQLLQVRQRISAAIGNQVVVSLARNDIDGLHIILDQMVIQDPDIQSIGVRRSDGTLVAASKEHTRLWVPTDDGKATLTQVPMPLSINKARWGEIELAFKNGGASTIWAWLNNPGVLLSVLFATIGLIAFYLYLRRALQYLDPSQAVPERVRKAFDTLTESVLILDVESRVMLANSSFKMLHPEADKRLDGKPVSQLSWLVDGMPKDNESDDYPWEAVIRSNQTVQGKRLKIPLPSGKSREVMMNCSAISDGSGIARGCLVSFNDVTQLSETNQLLQHTLEELQVSQDKIQQQNEELKKLAHFDPLTGCLNRRAFFSQGEELFREVRDSGKEGVCIMTDIDHFKLVNDRYGHPVGDLVIQQVATMLERALRTQDLLCRYGGEEFCIFLPDVDVETAAVIGERMRSSIEKGAGPGIRTVEGLLVTSSYGIASIKAGGKTLAEMIEQADQALYKAKKTGRNKVVIVEDAAKLRELQTQEEPNPATSTSH